MAARFGGLSPLPVLPPPAQRRELRVRVGWSITAAASALGVARQTYRRWESGEVTPTVDNLRSYDALLTAFREAG